MVLGQRDQKVQAFPPERTQEPLTEGIRLGTSHGSFEDTQPQMAYTLVEFPGEDRIAVMDEEAIGMRNRDRFTQLLERPRGRGVHGHIGMEDSTSRMFHDDEDIQEAKGRRDDDTEIAGNDGLGVIAHKGPPPLGPRTWTSTIIQMRG